MSDSIRYRILKALQTIYGGPDICLMTSIRAYVPDLEARGGVLVGLIDQDFESPESRYGFVDVGTFPVSVERIEILGDRPTDFRALSELRSLRAHEILQTLMTVDIPDRKLGGLAKTIFITSGGTFYPDQDGSEVVGAYVNLNVPYDQNLLTPNEVATP